LQTRTPCYNTTEDTFDERIFSCVNTVTNGDFELGFGSGTWTETSTNFGTPLCDSACGTGGLPPTPNPNYWVWFGGIGISETGEVAQSLTINAGPSSAAIEFQLAYICPTISIGFVNLRMDGTILFTQDCTGGAATIPWALHSVDVSGYIDGNPHALSFDSTTQQDTGQVTNFMVDAVVLVLAAGTTE
jgi:hypothetical protein